MAGRLEEPNGSKRICYSCGNSYPDIFRFCPIDSADLEYLPQPIEELARDFRRPRAKWWIAGSVFAVFMLASMAWMNLDRPAQAPVYSAIKYGELTVRTTPAGAKVYLDGSQVGISPVRLSDIPTGGHEVRAVCPGYSDSRAHVEIRPSAAQKLVWDLAPLPSRKSGDRKMYLTELPTNRIAAGNSETPAESPI